MHTPTSVALLGHNSIVREGLRRILADENFEITQSVDDPLRLDDEAVGRDALIVVDGGLDHGSADCLRSLRSRFPQAKLVVLSDAFDFDAMVQAFGAGAHGYIVKEISCEPLIGSLRLVAMGEKVMPTHLVDVLPSHRSAYHRDDARKSLEGAKLSDREQLILSCLITGCPNKVISRRLLISEATVKVHIKAILRKLRVKNRTQAAIHGVIGGVGEYGASSAAGAIMFDGPALDDGAMAYLGTAQ